MSSSVRDTATALPKVTSFGGCVIYQTTRYLDGQVLEHIGHRWRRPTLATMSAPIDSTGMDLSKMPAIFRRYFESDLSKQHLPELLSFDRDAILVTDFQRDIATGVIEIEPDTFAMDPFEAVHLIDDLTPESMSPEILAQVIRRDFKPFSAFRDWDRFFPLWQRDITRFLDAVTAHFKHVIISEQYQTLQRLDRTSPFYADRVERANVYLAQMYDFARTRKDITLIKVDPKDLYTGRTGGPYGGPVPVHYIDESYALWENALTEAINTLTGSNHDRSRRIYDVAFKRAADHEAALEDLIARDQEIDSLKTERAASESELNGKITQLEQQLATALEQTSRLQSEIDARDKALAEKRQRLQIKRERLAQNEHRIQRLQKQLDEYHAAPWRLVRKVVARRTRAIRSR